MTSVSLILIAVVVLASAAVAMSLRNLVRSALVLTLNWLGLAGFYLLMGAEFLALAQALIYVGAVSMVVLFAVLLTRPEEGGSGNSKRRGPDGETIEHSVRGSETLSGATPSRIALGLATAALVGGLMGWAVISSRLADTGGAAPLLTVKDIGVLVTGPHAIALLVVGVILTVALVGAMMIAAPRFSPNQPRSQARNGAGERRGAGVTEAPR